MQQVGFGLAQRFLDQYVRQSRNFRGRLRQRSNLQHIAQHDADVFPALETGQHYRAVRLKRPGAEARQSFVKLLAGEAAVEILLAQKRGQQVGILD